MDQLPDAQVHLEKGKAVVHPFLERFAHRRAGGLVDDVRIAVHADLVAESAAKHLIDGHAVRFAGQIPQRDLDPAHAAPLTGMAAELLDAAKQLVDVAGVLAQQPAFGDLRVDLVRAVAYFAKANQSLVGIHFDQAAVKRGADDVGEADIGDAELRRARMRIYVGKRIFVGLLVRHINHPS